MSLWAESPAPAAAQCFGCFLNYEVFFSGPVAAVSVLCSCLELRWDSFADQQRCPVLQIKSCLGAPWLDTAHACVCAPRKPFFSINYHFLTLFYLMPDVFPIMLPALWPFFPCSFGIIFQCFGFSMDVTRSEK